VCYEAMKFSHGAGHTWPGAQFSHGMRVNKQSTQGTVSNDSPTRQSNLTVKHTLCEMSLPTTGNRSGISALLFIGLGVQSTFSSSFGFREM
jgi:hypothetical protein